MDKKRRTVLKSIGGTGALLALAGCIGTEDDGADDADDGMASGDDGDDGMEPGDDADDGPDTEPGEALLWTVLSDAEEEDYDRFREQFEAESGHTITHENIGGELDDQLETAIPAGDGPDSWIWAHDWVGRFAVREEPPFIYDASDDLSVDLDVFSGAAQEAVQFDGGIYGLPFASETVTLFYNEDMVDEPPETLDEMIDIMDGFHNPAANEFGLSYPATDPYFASGFLQVYGGNLYDEDALEVTVDSDECKQGLSQLERLFDYIPADPGYEAQIVVFADGLAPFAINGPWEIGNLGEEIDNLGVTTMPTVDGNHPRTYTGIQMMYFSAMLNDADQSTRDAITEWTEYYTTSEEAAVTGAENHGFIPVLDEVVEGGDLTPEVEAFAEQVDHGAPMPSHPDMDSVWGPVGEALERVFNGDQEGDEALEQAAQEIRESL